MSRSILIAGNWKMNGTVEDSLNRINGIKDFLSKNGDKGAEILVCPPFTLLSKVVGYTADSVIKVGGQDCHFNKSGAHTGDISAAMLVDVGAKYVILGHSERRANHGETNEIVQSKSTAALENGLNVILCIGETLDERKQGKTVGVVSEQIKNSLSSLATPENFVIAYEPIWAIGTGLTPTIEEIAETHMAIRKYLASLAGEDFAQKTRILYGGSLNPANAKEILALSDVDGGLIGGASLKAEDFCKIIDAI
ncbi:MAG: triose-phosphate isomerase [Alphaproteobacteria bacterium]|jgi:triosephosphate isomerase|nr:triose-phosphate isomerase [Alphaproteobacteria bacterium]